MTGNIFGTRRAPARGFVTLELLVDRSKAQLSMTVCGFAGAVLVRGVPACASHAPSKAQQLGRQGVVRGISIGISSGSTVRDAAHLGAGRAKAERLCRQGAVPPHSVRHQ